jgi:hypothetical protein
MIEHTTLDRPDFCGDLTVCLPSVSRCRVLHEVPLPEGVLELHRRNVTAPGVQPFMIVPVKPCVSNVIERF